MNKLSQISVFLILISWISPLQAQKVINECKLEPAIIEVLYKRTKVTDTLFVEKDFRIDFLTLRAGKEISAFYSAKLKAYDSLSVRNFEYAFAIMQDHEAFKAMSELEREVLFKNYPTGKITNHTRHSLCNWVFEEDWEKPTWEITDSTSTVGDYECLLAVSDYRGRRWYAWFTPEIPISEGPWKLCGLPGLILEVRDEKNHYQYSALIIKLNPGYSVEYFNYDDRLKTNRMTSLKNKRKFLQKSVRDLILSSGAYGINPKVRPAKTGKSKQLPHRNYDFEEIDYPHE